MHVCRKGQGREAEGRGIARTFSAWGRGGGRGNIMLTTGEQGRGKRLLPAPALCTWETAAMAVAPDVAVWA